MNRLVWLALLLPITGWTQGWEAEIDRLDAEQTIQDNAINGLNVEQGIQNDDITALNAEQTAQNGRLDALEAVPPAVTAPQLVVTDQGTVIGTIIEITDTPTLSDGLVAVAEGVYSVGQNGPGVEPGYANINNPRVNSCIPSFFQSADVDEEKLGAIYLWSATFNGVRRFFRVDTTATPVVVTGSAILQVDGTCTTTSNTGILAYPAQQVFLPYTEYKLDVR